jgi:hypothetical protein
MTRVSLPLVLAALATFPGPAGAQPIETTALDRPLDQAGYGQVAVQRGVTVFKHKSSRDLRFAAEGLLEAPPAKLLAALIDYERQAKIIRRVSRSQILERGPNWLVVYQRLALPTISDRDYVLRVTWGDDHGTYWLRYSASDHPRAPAKPSGVVRLHRHAGSWQLRRAPDGRATLARYEWMIDLGGWVPRWMVRSRLADEMSTIFPNIQQLTTTATGKGS